MYSLVNNNFNRTYNPRVKHNALSDIKRLLTSRDTATQAKACGYLIEVISKYEKNSSERARLLEYLLENDVIVFLCEVASNLDFNLLRSVLQCIRLIWNEKQFFTEIHAPHAMATVIRALTHYSAISNNALDICLHFLCDLLGGINKSKTTSPLSHQSAYSTEQLLSVFNFLSSRINISSNPKSILSSSLVLQELISYQPDDLVVDSRIAKDLYDIIKKWLELLIDSLNHQSIISQGSEIGLYLITTCQIAMNTLGLIKILEKTNLPSDVVNDILTDKNEVDTLKNISLEMKGTVQRAVTEIVVFVKDNIQTLANEEYGTFLKLVLSLYYESNSSFLSEFSDVLLSNGYLAALPKVQIERNDDMIRKLSTMLLGELLKVLTEKYLFVNIAGSDTLTVKDIHLGLVELQNGIEKPQNIGLHLQKNQPYSLLIYIYFYCQSSENPEECTAPLLPYLVEYILRLPQAFNPPSYIIKALWLVFAMSTISHVSRESLAGRVRLERATCRLVRMLRPALFYTHHPAVLYWTFTSLTIPRDVRVCVLSQWLKTETSLPEDLMKEPLVWELLLDVLTNVKDKIIIANCMTALNACLVDGNDNFKEDFGALIWSILPGILSKALIGSDSEIDTNICYLLDIATNLLPSELDSGTCLKIAVFLTTIFAKDFTHNSSEIQIRHHYDYVCLNLCMLLLKFSSDRNDTKVLLTYTNKTGFMSNVLRSINSPDESVCCAALRLLTHIVHYYQKNKFHADALIKLLRAGGAERCSGALQLAACALAAPAPPVALAAAGELPSLQRQCHALRALMFRIQIVLCYRDSENRSTAGWKTLSSIFKHAIVNKNDPKLVALLTCQPWTYTLIRFQLAHDIGQEFLTFLKNWLILLKIAIKKNRQERKIIISKYSLITRTMVLINRSLNDYSDKDLKDNILGTVGEILEECSSRK